MSTLILLGGGTEAVPIIQRARDLGYRTIVVDGNPHAPGFAIADRLRIASCYHGAEAIHELHIIGEKYDGVLCAAVDAPVAAAEIAAEFGLPGLSVEAARLGQDKLNQKWILRSVSVPVPRSAAWDGDDDNLPAWADVVKPVDSRGGRGVVRLLPSVDAAWAYEQAKAHSPTGRVMVEQWLDGPQLSTESIVQDGRVLFTAVGMRNYARLEEFSPFVVEDGFDEPWGDYDWPPRSFEIDKVVSDACQALGWYQNGIVKGDLVIHNGRVYVIELAARLSGGFFASHGHPLGYGVDFVGAAIQAALGYRLNEPNPYAGGYVSQRYVFPDKGDIGKTVSGFKPVFVTGEDGQIPTFCTWNIKTGDIVQPVTCHPNRWGQALATGRTPDEARRRAEAAVTAMKAGVILE